MNVANKIGELLGISLLIFFIISLEYLIIVLINRTIRKQLPNKSHELTFASLLFSPVGKLSRLNYFLGCLGAIIFSASLFLLPSILDIIFGNLTDASSPSTLRIVFLMLIFLILLYTMICLTMKRLHDAGLQDWFAFVIIIPALNILALIVFIFLPGKKNILTIDRVKNE